MTSTRAMTTPDPGAQLEPIEIDETPRPGEPNFYERHKRIILAAARLAIILAILLAWWVAGNVGWLNPLTFPSITDTWNQIVAVTVNGTIFTDSLFTLEAAAIGFAIGMIAGTLLGFVIGLSPTLTSLLGPFISVLNTLPRIAVAPLYVLWFGIGTASGVALVVSLVIFTALLSVISGTQSVDRNYILIARLYGASRIDIVRKVVLPATTPWVITAGRLSLAHALAGAIVSEMFLGQYGLGYLIANGSGSFNMGIVFAAILASLIMATIFDRLGTFLEDHLLRWRPKNTA